MSPRKPTAVLCSSCGRLISVEETTCPHCGALQPALFGMAPALRRLFGEKLDLVYVVAAGCVGMFALSLAADPGAVLEFRGIFNLASPTSRALFLLGMTGSIATASGQWWTLLTANFLHGGLIHLAFNLSWIRSLGPVAVQELGPARFFVVYMLTGVAGFFASALLGNPATIGASAAIFGLVGLLAGMGLRRNGRLNAYISRNALTWTGIAFVLGFMGWMPVNNVAHGGGLAAGFALAWLVNPPRRQAEGRAWQLAALLLLLATVAGVGLSAWRMWSFYKTGVPPCYPGHHV